MSPAPEEPTITTKQVSGLFLYCNGTVAALVDSNNVTGIVCAKMNQNSDVFEVEFLDENNEIINDDLQQSKLAWAHDKQYAKIELASDWEFCIFGKKTGETVFQLQLENGGSVAYSSPDIPLEIK